MEVGNLLPESVERWDRTAHAEATAQIRERILSGAFPAGARLVQADLAERMGTSITPIREALRQLAAEGLIDIGAYRGAVVHTPTLAELEELYAVRHQLVPLAVKRRILTISDEELMEASEIADAMKGERDDARWVELNRRFHHVIDPDPTHSPVLSVVLRRLADLSALYVNISMGTEGRRQEADLEHREIVRAFQQRDADRLVRLIRTHLKKTREHVRRILSTETASSDGAVR